MHYLIPILYAVGGFFVAQIAQRVFVPILVMLLGERRFASPSAFDGCTLGIVGGFVALFLWVMVTAPRSVLNGLGWLPLVAVAVGITLYGLVWLWVLGLGAKKRQWRIEGERVLLNSDGSELRPTFVREDSDYYQTDAFNGYSHYFLELRDDNKKLATNAYTSKTEFEGDLKRVSELLKLRRLDLIWLHRIEPTRWRYVRFSPKWAEVLCGSLSLLSDDDREWWRGWVYPAFKKRIGIRVNAADAKLRVERLRAAYPELLTPPDEPDAMFQIVGRAWADHNFDLDNLLAVDGDIFAVSDERFYRMVRTTLRKEGGGQIMHDLDGVAVLS